MTISQQLKIPTFVIFFILLLVGCDHDTPDLIYQQTSNYDYEDTLLNLDIAISEHNYRIIHRSKIGQAVRDRGEKGFPLSIVISFCNITYAKEMMEINSSLINDMPCIITVREEKDTVVIGTKLMSENTDNQRQNDFAKKINRNLKSIIANTIE